MNFMDALKEFESDYRKDDKYSTIGYEVRFHPIEQESTVECSLYVERMFNVVGSTWEEAFKRADLKLEELSSDKKYRESPK